MPSSTSNFDFVRPIPDAPWRGMALVVAGLVLIATIGWEMRARSWGYKPGLNDTHDLWADWRAQVKPDSLVVIGDSRALFDTDLDALEAGLGQRPIQLAMAGTCAYPVLESLANDESFHGTVISSLIPLMWLAPPPSPPFQHSVKALERWHKRTYAQRSGHYLGMLLEERFAFMNEDLQLETLLGKVHVPERAAFHPPPLLPVNFSSIARDRRTRMWDACAQPGWLQDRIKYGWLPLFTPPPPPSYVPPEVFGKMMGEAIEKRFVDTAAAVKKIQARGGHVVFVRYPFTGDLKKAEDKATPRVGPWTRIIKESGASAVYFEDYPDLASFDCPEWSHLSDADSVEFSKRLVPHIKDALAQKAALGK